MLKFLVMATFMYINSPDVEMRVEPHAEAEVASHAYFSEEIKVLEEKGEWTKIETLVDEGKGWVKGRPFCTLETSYPDEQYVQINRCAAHIYHIKDTIYGPILTLPFESKLQVVEWNCDPRQRWMKIRLPCGGEGYIQQGDIIKPRVMARNEMCALSHFFLGLPYTWGGRSSFGYDCSGFVQMLYRQMGIHLPRTSRSQCHWSGFSPIQLEYLSAGDLIFFGESESEIHHVGLYLGNDQFIHASIAEHAPYIHTSTLSEPEWSGGGHLPFRTFRTLKAL